MMAVLWTGGVGPVAALLVLAPLLIARWAFQQYGEQHKAYEATVASLIRAVETKDYYTRGHSERVAKASVMLAEQLGMREDRLEMLQYAGMLHDVGKLGVPTKLLQKTGPLDDSEFATIKLHPTRGVEMVNGIAFLNEAMLGIRHHHERVDGLGYPDGLAGEQIPEFARIIAVADAFDSMTSTRSYRSARSVEAATRELKRWAGTQFDARMVDALISAVESRGWESNVEPSEEVVDPAVLVFRDHDDPGADIAAFGTPPYQRTAEYDLRAEVS
jgi:HD-GYP domain-containing protein (c-di-GMP phosphodiesterase class II)